MFAYVIDSEADIRDMLGLRLSSIGYEIMAFCSYTDACVRLLEGAATRVPP